MTCRQWRGCALAIVLAVPLVAATGASVLRAQQPPVNAGANPQSTAPRADQQTPPVTFKVEVNYVEVDAVVLDKQGNFVRDLKMDDFQLLEDGKPQKIRTYSFVEIPVERAEKPLFVKQPIDPDVQTNARGTDGRIYMLVLDDLHTAALRSERVRAAARRFVQQMGANDQAATSACCSRRSASSWGESCGRRRSRCSNSTG
jgi:hypothetical protein